jgi:molybdate transport system substrate-binding protein
MIQGFIHVLLILLLCFRANALVAARPESTAQGSADSCSTVTVAVASNFVPTLKAMLPGFEAQTCHRLRLVSGSSGRLYAQIHQGAPFDVFLSADEAKPARLVEEGHAVAASRFTYASGRLGLWAVKAELDPRALLLSGDVKRLAMANPKLAPYGLAAQQTLEALAVNADQPMTQRLLGENIAQTYQFVASGNAELGFIALSQYRLRPQGTFWLVPLSLHLPIKQDAVLLSRAAGHAGSMAFLDYLKSSRTQSLIRKAGYE